MRRETSSYQWSLPRGRVLQRALRSDPTQEYLLYVPETAGPDAPVLVSVHGISRNAYEQATVFSALCRNRGVVMLVPMFTVEQHADYQRLGRKGRGMRVDLLLQKFLAEVHSLTGADVSRIHLFGFSGGAQFAHRFLLCHPHRVACAAIVAAGWYTFPDHSERYPFGIRPHRTLAGVPFNPEEFLRVPVEVLVGQLDTTSRNLRSTARVNAQQGETRLERARRWVLAMREAARNYGLEPRVSLTEVPGIAHSFREFSEQGDLVARVERSLFAEESSPVRIPALSANGASNGNGSHPQESDGRA